MEDIEKINQFISVDSGYGSGDGSGNGDGYGSGYGAGSGDDDGSGGGYGSGYGAGYGYGLKALNGLSIYIIDGVQTIVARVKENIAKGAIVNADLTTTPCYVVKQDNTFAHGATLREAHEELMRKLFEDMSVDERIDAFVDEFSDFSKPYKTADFFDWHGRLTISCLIGRNQFVKDRGIDLSGCMTVADFIKLTENAYQGEIIRELKERYGVFSLRKTQRGT